jgi:hypothetical protein
MIGVLFLALILTIFLQMIQLQRALVREQMLQNEAEQSRAEAQATADFLRSALEKAEASGSGNP